MYMKKVLAFVDRTGRRSLAMALACAIGVAFAQNAAPAPAAPSAQPTPAPAQAAPAAPAQAAPAQDQRPMIGDVEIRAGARGMVLLINGSGPIALGSGKPEGTAAKYPELRVTINNARSGLGPTATFKAPDALPVKEIVVTETANGVSLVVKMRGLVNGPVDIRGGGNQVRILLTKDAQPEMVWSAIKGAVSAPPPPAAQPAPAPTAAKPAQPAPVAQPTAQPPAVSQPLPAKAPSTPAPARAAAQPKAPAVPQVAPKSETPAAQEEANIKPDGEVTKRSPDGGLVRYKVFGRDPFVPLVRDTSDTGVPRVENLRLVGVLEDSHERIALVEDFKNGNRAFALRTNDAVESGKVLRVHRDKVVFLIRDFDVSRSYTLSLSNTK